MPSNNASGYKVKEMKMAKVITTAAELNELVSEFMKEEFESNTSKRGPDFIYKGEKYKICYRAKTNKHTIETIRGKIVAWNDDWRSFINVGSFFFSSI